jgi:hypothetical protein
MTNSCTPPKSFDVFLERRQLTLNRHNDNYNKIVEKLVGGNLNNVPLNNEVLVLFNEINNDNVSVVPNIEYELNTLEKYRKSTQEKTNTLKKVHRKLKNNNSSALVASDKLKTNIEKNKELSIKYSFLMISILLLFFASVGILVFVNKN